MKRVKVCGHVGWELNLPAHRAAREQWPWHEKPRLESMHANLRPGDVVVDVGAEQGDQSALYARWVAGGAPHETEYDGAGRIVLDVVGEAPGGVVLVEPNPVQWPCIRAVFEANDLVPPLMTFPGFLSDHDDFREEVVVHDWPLGVDPSDCGENTVMFLEDERGGFPVATLDSLDVFLTQDVDAVSIDVEGYEITVLDGAFTLLRHRKPLVWVSIHPQLLRDRGNTWHDVLDVMSVHGYEVELLAEDHELHAFFYHPDGRRPVLPYGGK